MATTVDQIMNREVFTLRTGNSIDDARYYLTGLGISSAPVLDPYGRAVGILSIKDVLSAGPGSSVAERMTRPALSIRADSTIDEAAQAMAEQNLHHAAVVNHEGFVVGMLSLVDVLKALRGLPVEHPDTYVLSRNA